MAMFAAQTFLDTAAVRRSVYTIKDTNSPLSSTEIVSIVKQALDICPSPWNNCSSCCLILLGAKHKEFFGMVIPAMQAVLPPEAFESQKGKLKGLAAGLGTVLFFENRETLDSLVQSSPRTEPMIDSWSNVVSGMLQYTVWTTFSVAGFGCSLQHFDWNSDLVAAAHKKFNIPSSWELKAQLVFGSRYEEPPEKRPYKPGARLEDRLRVVA